MACPHPRRRQPSTAFAIAPFLALFAAVAGLSAEVGAAPAAAAESIELQLPIRCKPGADCWLVNLVDIDPGPDVRDYACGKSTYNGHKGTDIAIRDMKAVAAGVDVVAAAPGVVRATRDGMKDVDVAIAGKDSVKGRECGNGVVLVHDGGWETQYCHMRKGSVVVSRGDRVAAGQKLGHVGHSGDAQFPHLHLSVRHSGAVVDPFVGLGRDPAACGPGPRPLWREDAMAALAGGTTAIFNIGFHDAKPDLKDVRNGVIGARTFSRDAAALVLWADMYWPQAGDDMRFRIVAPDGRPLIDRTEKIEKTQARRFAFVGKRKRSGAWPTGDYTGEVTLTRGAGGPGARVFKSEARVRVR